MQRTPFSLVACLFLVPAVAESQTSNDSLAVARTAIARFAEHRAVRIDPVQPAEPFGRGRGPRHSREWLDSLALSERVAVCNSDACSRLPTDSVGVIRISRPTFVGPDTAEIVVLSTVRSGPSGCPSWDETAYSVTVVKVGARWILGSTRAHDHAWYVDTLCFGR